MNVTKFLRRVALLTLIGGLGLQTAHAQVAKANDAVSLRDALKTMLQDHGASGVVKLTVNVSGEQAAGFMSTYGVDLEGSYSVYNGVDAAKAVVGSVVIVNEQGKEGPLQMLVAVNPAGDVYDTGFTVFGEDKGKPAIAWTYLRQFIGKTTADALTVGDDINGISGATWSSESVARAAKRALAIHKEYIASDE